MIILVADDFDDARRLLRLLLEHKGHRVLEARNGQEAVQTALMGKPDLILMDLNMPIMSGLAATERLRAHAATARIPVLAMSACADRELQDAARAAGCDEFWPKPLNLAALGHAVARFGSRRAPEADAGRPESIVDGTARPKVGGEALAAGKDSPQTPATFSKQPGTRQIFPSTH